MNVGQGDEEKGKRREETGMIKKRTVNLMSKFKDKKMEKGKTRKYR